MMKFQTLDLWLRWHQCHGGGGHSTHNFLYISMSTTRMHSRRMCIARSSSPQLWGGRGSASVHAGIYHPWLWAWRPCPAVGLETPLGVGLETPTPRPDTSTSPLGVGLETPPQPDPSSSPIGVGLETCKACWDTTPPNREYNILRIRVV